LIEVVRVREGLELEFNETEAGSTSIIQRDHDGGFGDRPTVTDVLVVPEIRVLRPEKLL
jgi:hypothetical protein